MTYAQPPSPRLDPQTGLWGYQQTEGAWHIAPGYFEAGRFSEGLAVVTVDEQMFISSEGAVYPPMYRVKDAIIWRPQHVIDTSGMVVWSLPIGYAAPSGARYGEGLLPVRSPRGQYGYVGRDGQEVIPFRWRRAWSYASGWAAVQVEAASFDSLYFTLSRSLQEQITQQLRLWRRDTDPDMQERFPYGGLDVFFLDSSGKVCAVLPSEYAPATQKHAFRFEEGYLPVQSLTTGKLGLLDQQWREAIPCRYEQLGLMSETCVFAVRRPTYLPDMLEQGIDEDTLFVGYLNPASQAVFSLSPGFWQGDCRYRIEGTPMQQGEAWIWLYPLYCEEKIGLRVSRDGRLLEYVALPIR